jgi:hypothetical protein
MVLSLLALRGKGSHHDPEAVGLFPRLQGRVRCGLTTAGTYYFDRLCDMWHFCQAPPLRFELRYSGLEDRRLVQLDYRGKEKDRLLPVPSLHAICKDGFPK